MMFSVTNPFKHFSRTDQSDALEEYCRKVSIGGRIITSLRFTDDIDAAAQEEWETEALVESLDDPAQGMELK